MTLRLPGRTVAHLDASCAYVRGKAVSEPLIAPAWDEVCQRCRRRLQRQRGADRAARAEAVRAAARAVCASDSEAVIEYVSALSRRSVG